MGKTLDDENVSGNDPGYMAIMEKSGVSWWNTNPIYVARQEVHCCSQSLFVAGLAHGPIDRP